jgi:hypothetical protein
VRGDLPRLIISIMQAVVVAIPLSAAHKHMIVQYKVRHNSLFAF